MADDIRGLLGSIQDYLVRGDLDKDVRSVVGPHAYEGMSNIVSLANFFGPGADVKDVASESAKVMEGDTAALAGLPAALAMMAIPGSKSGIEEVIKPTRRPDGSFRYKEFDIVKDGDEYRFRHPADKGYELYAETLDDAKAQIDDIFEETFGKVLSDEKATGWLKNHGYDPYVGIGPRPKTPYYEFTEDGAIKTYTPYGGNKSGVEVKTFRNPTRKQLRDWMGYKSGGRVERNPYNHEPKAI